MMTFNWSEGKGDLFYKHSSNVPYTGLATDNSIFFEIGYFKDGKREGVWPSYWFNDSALNNINCPSLVPGTI